MSEEQATGPVPIVFEYPLEVIATDIDTMGHVNNIVYLRWVQEVATAHWNAATTDQQKSSYAWVALRHELDYLRPAFLGDTLVARTHVGEATGARFERYVEIWRTTDTKLVAKMRSVWVAIDPQTGKPRRVEAALYQQFYIPS